MPAEDIGDYPPDIAASSKSLVSRELARMKDFAAIAENPAETISATTELTIAFDIKPDSEETDYV